MNLQIKILIGIPASGKSTWAKSFVMNNPNWVRVCRDDFRYMFQNIGYCEPKIEDMITELVNQSIRHSLKRKLNVLVDATNLKRERIQEFIEEFKYEADINYQVFDISYEKALERDNNRERKVGEQVLKRMYDDYKVFIDSFHFQPHTKIERRPIIKPDYNLPLPAAIICDIDGTLAHMSYKRGPFDWDKVNLDTPNYPIIEMLTSYKYLYSYHIILLSGRDESCRNLTESWLKTYNIPYNELFMRSKNDFRKDNIIKQEIYMNEIIDKWNVLFAIDDRLQVLQMWYELGIFTFNVNQGNIDF